MSLSNLKEPENSSLQTDGQTDRHSFRNFRELQEPSETFKDLKISN